MTKQEIMDLVCSELGLVRFKVSTGSTEPKAFLVAVAEQLGLASTRDLDKIGIAKSIVESRGQRWELDYDSRGATITRKGLLAVLAAVRGVTRS